jgi:hypothetical protein
MPRKHQILEWNRTSAENYDAQTSASPLLTLWRVERHAKPCDFAKRIGALWGFWMKERSQHRSAGTAISSDAQQGHCSASGRTQPSYFGSIRSGGW